MSTMMKFSRTAHRSKGVTLVELMVAIVISLVLLAGITQLYLANKRNYTALETLGRMQENGRYAIDTIARDIRRSGYWGLYVWDIGSAEGTEAPPETPSETCTSAASSEPGNWGLMLERSIFGLNYDPDDTGYGACVDGSDHTAGDILVVRYASPQAIPDGDMEDGKIYIRTSPYEALIFRGADKASNIFDPGYQHPVKSSELIAHAYYIGDSVQQCQGNSVPALYRVNLDDEGRPGTPEEIAIGVEELQLQLGIDTDPDDGTSAAHRYRNPDELVDDDWEQVVAARVWILMRGECQEYDLADTNTYSFADYNATPGDNYRRQLYSTTVKLRNR